MNNIEQTFQKVSLRGKRVTGQLYSVNDRMRIWSGSEWMCAHNSRPNRCRKCGKQASHPAKSIEEFLSKSRRKHGDYYNYEKTVYIRSQDKVVITCPIHGDFLQTPSNHYKFGCKLCGRQTANLNTRKTTQYFISKAQALHGDKYGYDKVIYVGHTQEVIIVCALHGEYSQTPAGHLASKGCMQCGIDARANLRRLPIAYFLTKAKEIHGDTYDYSEIQYIDIKTPVGINCRKHGQFMQIPEVHLRSAGCPTCSHESTASILRKTTDDFIREAREVHGDRFDYSLVKYKSYHSNVTIICAIHGNFDQSPASHLAAKKCPPCSFEEAGDMRKKTTEEFIMEAVAVHGNRYDYSQVVYSGEAINVCIICEHHGEFLQTPSSHLHKKSNCPQCSYITAGLAHRKTLEQFIEDAINIHSDLYDYSLVKYVGDKKKIEIICKKHQKSFLQVPSSHLRGSGCPLCVNKTAGRMFVELQYIYPNIQREGKFEWCKNKKHLPFDFVLPDEKIIIELDGEQHFIQVNNWTPFQETQQRDRLKMKAANTNGYSVLRLLQTDVYGNKYDWKNELRSNVAAIITKKELINIFMCKQNEYSHFKNESANENTQYLNET